MRADAIHHPGLPIVPAPARDELLGAWLLRIAQPYGLGMATLLTRLAAQAKGSSRAPRWFNINGADLNLNALSTALHVKPANLAAMAPIRCRPHWPQELGLCRYCLEEAASAGQPATWYRRWMHPLATVCGIHRVWLTPVATRAMTRVDRADDLASLVSRLRWAQEPPSDELAPIDDAQWLQQVCLGRNHVRPPWGKTAPHQLIRIVDTAAHLMLSASAARANLFELPHNRNEWFVKAFTLERLAGGRIQLMQPMQLRHRQWVLGRVGHLLRHPSQSRRWSPSWPTSLIKRMMAVSTQNWPAGALEWICPEAAELVQRTDALRTQIGVSPRYFRACSDLFARLESNREACFNHSSDQDRTTDTALPARP